MYLLEFYYLDITLLLLILTKSWFTCVSCTPITASRTNRSPAATKQVSSGAIHAMLRTNWTLENALIPFSRCMTTGEKYCSCSESNASLQPEARKWSSKERKEATTLRDSLIKQQQHQKYNLVHKIKIKLDDLVAVKSPVTSHESPVTSHQSFS